MASYKDDFRVLIAGGGVAGLTLANMLEKFNIDYLVLEAHGTIAPEVGASIGLLPNGLRILDQIGCLEAIRDVMDGTVTTFYLRDSDGHPLTIIDNYPDHTEKRHGYPIMFFDRQWLLQILYDNLQHKTRVLLNRRVARIDHIDGGVEATTESGERYRGTFIVGVDGVHSAVRKEMYRLGRNLEPGRFQPEDGQVPCYYLCSFGIAKDVPGWVNGEGCTVLGNGSSQLILSGPKKRVYWFFFAKLPEVKYGKDIPRCSKEMEAQFVESRKNVAITPTVTFGQVYSKRLYSTLTPLHEVVYEKWFFQRIMIFGDAAHKPNPIGGQGGNGAIESAAELLNAILRKRDKTDLNHLANKDVEEIFAETQASRHERAKSIVEVAHTLQSLNAFEKPLLSNLVLKVLGPARGQEVLLERTMAPVRGSSRIEKLPIKPRPRAIPYDDELPANPVKPNRLIYLLFSCLMVLHIYATFTRAVWVDSPHTMPAASEGNTKPLPLPMHFMPQLLAPILVYTIEGYRSGNKGTPLALPILFLVALRLQGICRIAPLYAILSALSSFQLRTGRYIGPEVTSMILPSILLAGLAAMIFKLCLIEGTESWQTWAMIWQIGPVLFSVFLYSTSTVYRYWTQSGLSSEEKNTAQLEDYRDGDAPSLLNAYRAIFIIQALAHIFNPLNTSQQLGTSISTLPSAFYSCFQTAFGVGHESASSTTAGACNTMVAVSAWAFSNLFTIGQLRQYGFVKTNQALTAAASFIAGQLLVGPGAAWVGVWYWREQVLLRLKRE